MTSKLTSIADEKIEDVIKMARESAKIYGGEWDSALIAESPGNNVHGITSDHIEAVVVKTADDSLHSSWLCDYLESVSPAFVIAALRELQERRKADSEPVAEVVSIYGDHEAFGEREIRPLVGIQQMPYGTKLYRYAQPAPERDQVRSAHAEWSQATFGNVGPVGPLKHLSKEALEAAAEPGDLSEWADMQFLLWDAQRRAGITDEQITQAMIDKLAVNKQREWPEPKDGEPRLHIKEQDAPVVPEEATPDSIEILASARRRDHAVFQWDEDQRNAAADSWNACRAAILQGADGKPHLTVWYGSMPETNGKTNWTAMLHRKGQHPWEGITIDRSEYPGRVRYEADRMRHLIGDLADEPDILAYDADAHSGYVPPAAPQSPGSEPATLPGKWIPVSERMPETDGNYWGWWSESKRQGPVWFIKSELQAQFQSSEITHWMPLPADPQEVKSES